MRAEIDYAFDFSAGGRDLFLFTSNVTGVEVPPERIREAYAYAATRPVASADAPEPAPRPWPWGLKHPDGYFGL